MVTSAHPRQRNKHNDLGILVTQALHAADRRRFGRISVRGLFCGFVELDGVVGSFHAKSLALQIARRVPGVANVVDLIRVVPGNANRMFPWYVRQ